MPNASASQMASKNLSTRMEGMTAAKRTGIQRDTKIYAQDLAQTHGQHFIHEKARIDSLSRSKCRDAAEGMQQTGSNASPGKHS